MLQLTHTSVFLEHKITQFTCYTSHISKIFSPYDTTRHG